MTYGQGSHAHLPIIFWCRSARLAFLRFHNLMLSRLHVDASSATLHVRLLKHILSSVGALLNPTSSSARAMESSTSSTAGGGKKGKKRMRDVGEDSLVGGMEGKAGRGLNGMEAKIVMECFKREWTSSDNCFAAGSTCQCRPFSHGHSA
jgi:hypothetical protein